MKKTTISLQLGLFMIIIDILTLILVIYHSIWYGLATMIFQLTSYGCVLLAVCNAIVIGSGYELSKIKIRTVVRIYATLLVISSIVFISQSNSSVKVTASISEDKPVQNVTTNTGGNYSGGTSLESMGEMPKNLYYNGTGKIVPKIYCNIIHHTLTEEKKCHKGLHVVDNTAWDSN